MTEDLHHHKLQLYKAFTLTLIVIYHRFVHEDEHVLPLFAVDETAIANTYSVCDGVSSYVTCIGLPTKLTLKRDNPKHDITE